MSPAPAGLQRCSSIPPWRNRQRLRRDSPSWGLETLGPVSLCVSHRTQSDEGKNPPDRTWETPAEHVSGDTDTDRQKSDTDRRVSPQNSQDLLQMFEVWAALDEAVVQMLHRNRPAAGVWSSFSTHDTCDTHTFTCRNEATPQLLALINYIF